MAIQSLTGAIGRNILTSVSVVDQFAVGGMLEWSITGSGLGGLSDLRLLDTLGDGQRMDTVFRPQAVVRRGSVVLFSGELLGWSGVRSAQTATTAINFDLAPTLRAAGLPGGPADGDTVSVTFHSRILSLYAALQAPTLGRQLGQGDPLRNTAAFSGTVAGAVANSDPSAAGLALPNSLLTASIYAVNGVRVVGAAHAAFGDVVTYRMRLELPLTAARRVELVASAPGVLGAFVFDMHGAAAAPPSGHAQFGPDGSYTATQPILSTRTDSAGNAVLGFAFGDVQPVYGNGPGTIELLFSTPLTPGAPLAFSAVETEANAFGLQAAVTAQPASLVLNEPSLRIQTATVYSSNTGAVWTGTGGPFGYSPDFGQFGGVISSDGLAREPFADRLSGVDAGDEVTFVIAVEGLVPGAKAYDVMVRASIPSGFVVPTAGAGLSVTDGAGTPLAYTGDLFDPQGGLALDAAAPVAGYDATSGLNVLLISYTLRTADNLDLSLPIHVSTAQIVRYAAASGWANRAAVAAAGNAATTEVATVQPSVTIALVATSDPATAGTLLGLGETATFWITATLPEGLSRALAISALLPAGFTAVSTRVVALGANIKAQTQAADGAGGIVFGDTLNAPDGLNTVGDQIIVEVVARPTRTPDGPAPHALTVQGTVSIGPPGGVSTATGAVAITIAEPAPPAVTGLPASEIVRDDTSLAPFAGIAVTRPEAGHLQTLRVTMSDPGHGVLTNLGAGRYDRLAGVYTVTGSDLATAAAALRFIPTRHQAGLGFQVQTDLSVQVQDSAGAIGAAVVTRVTASGTNSIPVVRNAAPGQVVVPGAAVRLFTGLTLQDADAGQVETLTIQFADTETGALSGAGPGRFDPATGAFTSSGTLSALTAEAGRLLFTAAGRPTAAAAIVTITIDDGAGGVARDTSTIAISASSVSGPWPVTPLSPTPFAPMVPPVQLFTGPAPFNVVVADPAGSGALAGTSGRDAYFVDGDAAGLQWDTLTGFRGGDIVVLWGYRPGVSSFTWSDVDGVPGQTGRTLRADVPGTGSATASLTFAGQAASDSDRFAVSTGRFNGLDYLAIVAPA